MPKIAMLFVTTTDIPIADALVEVRLTRSDFDDKISGVLMNRLESFRTDANGAVLVDLMTCKALYHVTVYDTVQDIAIHHDFYVPEDADPTTILRLQDLIVPPDTYLSSMPFDETAMLAIIDARNAARDAALQSQASAATAVSSAATAVAAIATVKADADKVEAWTATVDQQHTEVGGWAIQVAQSKTAVDAAVIAVNQDKVAAVNAAAGAKVSETNAANSAATASTDSQSATASKIAAAASASAASGSQTAAANSATSALASQASATQSASTATTAKNESLSYRDQANQSAQDALASKNSATASATSATAAKDSATASASASLTNATNAANSAIAAATSAAQAQASNNAATTSAANAYESARVANVAATASQNSATASQNSAAASAQSAADAAAALGNKLDKADVSVAPAANKVPRAAANGTIDPAWLDATKTAALGKITSKSDISVSSVGVPGIIEQLLLTTNAGGSGVAGTAIHFGYPGATTYGSRIVGAGDPTLSLSGYTAFETGINGGYAEKMRITGRGSLLLGTQGDNGTDKLQVIGTASFDTPTSTQGTRVFQVGLNSGERSLILFAGDGVMSGWPGTVLSVAKNSGTGRGIDTTGTVNTAGNDYAEYMFKCFLCGLILKGQIVGITADNTITDKWADAVMFAIKSTEPSFVGGDTWRSLLGPRPLPMAGLEPSVPIRTYDVYSPDPLAPEEGMSILYPGDTDEEWEARLANYTSALSKWGRTVELDRVAMADFDTKLEEVRARVDRIAIAGRVPVNVYGAQPGDYIVPVQDGEGISAKPVSMDDMTMSQYFEAVGRVVSIQEDGRAYVMVKVV